VKYCDLQKTKQAQSHRFQELCILCSSPVYEYAYRIISGKSRHHYRCKSNARFGAVYHYRSLRRRFYIEVLLQAEIADWFIGLFVSEQTICSPAYFSVMPLRWKMI
jgi:hypothetical protein